MLFAVEGGGFFSSSASGYSRGLTLLLLGRRNEERPMRVSPWNQYQLVDQEGDPHHQLASRKNRVSRGCASICFGRASAGADGPSPPKVGPVRQSEALPDSSSASDRGKACTTNDIDDESERKVLSLKSSLKKPSTDSSAIVLEGDLAHESLEKVQSNVSSCPERRKVQWADVCGRELFETREFEPSDEGTSDDEFEREGYRRCLCVIQ